MRRLYLLLAVLFLAGCSGVYQASGDCTGDEIVGVDCTGVSIRPYSPPTPLPVTMGRISLGDTWQPFTGPGTVVTWSVAQAAGPIELANYNQYVVVAATVPGDYVLEATWDHQGVSYRAPFTLTVVSP